MVVLLFNSVSRMAFTRCASNFRMIHSTTRLCNKSIYKTEEVKKIRIYVLNRFMQYMKKYEKLLETKFPKAFLTYRSFMDGIKFFYNDFKDFFKIFRMLNIEGKSFKELSLKEIELYHQMPRDLLRVGPVILLSTLPFTNYVILPLAYYFPRHLLTHHFWNIQQKSEFNIIILHNRLVHHKPVFRHLQGQLDYLKNNKLHASWARVLGLLGSGLHPTPQQIIECKELFYGVPYNLSYLSGNHIKHLIRMHGIHAGWFKRTRLGDRALMLRAMDRAIVREGGVKSLSLDNLRNVCLIRGLNPTNMKAEDMIYWLNSWIVISEQTDSETLSMLLHCPVLLGYNEPSNWLLIYPQRKNCHIKK